MTVEVPLTKGFVALIDDEDAALILPFKWYAMVRQFKTKVLTCAVRGVFVPGRNSAATIYMHRVILDCPKGVQVDHINHDGLDNRRANLRPATASQNIWNRRPWGNKHGFVGVVCWDGNYYGRLQFGGKAFITSSFKSPQDAARARDALAVSLQGEFAHLNFPMSSATTIASPSFAPSQHRKEP